MASNHATERDAPASPVGTPQMWIQTAWTCDDGDDPYLIAAYDEITWEAWGSEPTFYAEDKAKHPGLIREVRITVPFDEIAALFISAPEITGTVERRG